MAATGSVAAVAVPTVTLAAGVSKLCVVTKVAGMAAAPASMKVGALLVVRGWMWSCGILTCMFFVENYYYKL